MLAERVSNGYISGHDIVVRFVVVVALVGAVHSFDFFFLPAEFLAPP